MRRDPAGRSVVGHGMEDMTRGEVLPLVLAEAVVGEAILHPDGNVTGRISSPRARRALPELNLKHIRLVIEPRGGR